MKKHLPILFLLALVSWPAAAGDTDRGELTYKQCAGCHGFKGEGNALVNAPGIGGQESWYLARQLENFRSGVRGADEKDVNAHTMGLMARALKSKDDVDDVVAYIGLLPAAAGTTDRVEGDAGRGQALYGTCAACHGAKAEGNAALNAPALARMDDWYQLAQLHAFKSGRRGADARDLYGQQMAPMANTLTNEQAMKDVIAYIVSLR